MTWCQCKILLCQFNDLISSWFIFTPSAHRIDRRKPIKSQLHTRKWNYRDSNCTNGGKSWLKKMHQSTHNTFNTFQIWKNDVSDGFSPQIIINLKEIINHRLDIENISTEENAIFTYFSQVNRKTNKNSVTTHNIYRSSNVKPSFYMRGESSLQSNCIAKNRYTRAKAKTLQPTKNKIDIQLTSSQIYSESCVSLLVRLRAVGFSAQRFVYNNDSANVRAMCEAHALVYIVWLSGCVRALFVCVASICDIEANEIRKNINGWKMCPEQEIEDKAEENDA